MVRLAFRGAIGVLSVALAAGCLGGQTGQPSSAECDSTQLSSSAAWGNTTVGAAAEVFAGTYEAPLVWQQEPRAESRRTLVDLEDSLQLTIAYDGASVRRDCLDRLHVPVTVTLTSSASGIAESGDATLEILGSAGPHAGNLRYDGERLALDAMLEEVAPGFKLAGWLNSLDQALPGASASFAVEP